MRRCRKLISMIVMMAMLATMTPYQALAVETPVEASTETVATEQADAEEEPSQESIEKFDADENEEESSSDTTAAAQEIANDSESEESSVPSTVEVIEDAQEASTEEKAEAAEPEESAAEATTAPAAEELELITVDTELEYVASNEEYKVIASFGESAKLPVGVKLEVKEITQESDPDGYKEYFDKAVEELKAQGKYDENTTVSLAKFYDISFVYEGKEYEPEAEVKIRIEYPEAVTVDENTSVDALHFDEKNDEQPEVIDADKEGSETAVEAVEFAGDQFSVFAVVFTTSNEGSTYDYTMLLGDSIAVKDLAVKLGITTEAEADVFAADIEDVVSSNSDAVSVTDEEGEWTVKCVEAFDSAVTLTITMKDGKSYIINVTGQEVDAMEYLTHDWVHVPEGAFAFNTDDGCLTGTVEFDDLDADDKNDIVRTFDTVAYNMNYRTEVYTQDGVENVTNGYICYKFVLPADKSQAKWDIDAMGWMGTRFTSAEELENATKEGGTAWNNQSSCYYETEEDGKQILVGKKYLSPSETNPHAFPGAGTLAATVQVLMPENGFKFQPTFSLWADHNETDAVCEKHNVKEVQTIVSKEITVVSELRMNVKLVVNNSEYTKYQGDIDFDQADSTVINYGKGTVEGVMAQYALFLQLYNQNIDKGLRGCALPKGDITSDVNFTVKYKTDSGELIDLTALGYTPLVYSYGTSSRNTEDDIPGRIIEGLTNYPITAAPTDHLKKPADEEMTQNINGSCNVWNGGQWALEQEGSTLKFTNSDYIINPDYFPNCNNVGSGDVTGKTYYDYTQGVRACDIGTFAVAEFYMVLPIVFTDKDDNEIDLLEKYGAGSVTIDADDVNLMADSSAGSLEEVSDNTNQKNLYDDHAYKGIKLDPPGIYGSVIRYTYDYKTATTDTLGNKYPAGYYDTGQDSAGIGQEIGICSYPSVTTQGNADNMFSAFQNMVKFDADAIELGDNATVEYSDDENVSTKLLYGVKPDGSNWSNLAEQNALQEEDLVWYETLDEAEEHGKCVAFMTEARFQNEFPYTTKLQPQTIHQAYVRKDPELCGNVYPVIVSIRAWNRKDLKKLINDPDSGIDSIDSFPSRMDVQAENAVMPDSNIHLPADSVADFVPSVYENGVYTTGHTPEGVKKGDSLYIVQYQARITKFIEQVDESGKEKLKYNLDDKQRVADYSLAVRLRTDAPSAITNTTTVTVTDVLPKGLSLRPDSSYYGGTYQQVGSGKQGVITGGEKFDPVKIPNEDGTTTLIWTIENAEIGGVDDGYLPLIYYSCDIGEEGAEDDVENNANLLNTATVMTTEDTREPVIENGKMSQATIVVTRLKAASVSKIADHKIVEATDNVGWTVYVGNNSDNDIPNNIMLDTLPESGIEGTRLDADNTVKIKEWKIFTDVASNVDDWFAFYTTDTLHNAEGERLISRDFTYVNGQIEGNPNSDNYDVSKNISWTPAAITRGDDGAKITGVYDIEGVTGVAVIGTLLAQQTYKAHLLFDYAEPFNVSEVAEERDYLINAISNGDVMDTAHSQPALRILQGITWKDMNMDGYRDHDEDNSEEVISNVLVTLMKLNDEGVYEPYTIDGEAVTVQTGKIFNLFTGETRDYDVEGEDNPEGRYRFEGLPAGTFAVMFEEGGYADFDESVATLVDAGSDDKFDSDATPTYDEDQLVKAVIEGIEMPTLDRMSSPTFISKYHDLGLYQTGDLIVKKTVSSTFDPDKQELFPFTVTLDNTTINGTFGEGTTAMTFTDGVATFSLKDGEYKVAKDLPVGVGYTVTETLDATMAAKFTKDPASVTGTIIHAYADPDNLDDSECAKAEITNTRKTGSITISKAVVSPIPAESTKEFTFDIEVDSGVNGTYDDVTFTSGKAQITVAGGSSKTITGLPAGISYKITEVTDNDFTVDNARHTGTIEADQTKTAAFTNTRKTGSLTVRKTVESTTSSDKSIAFNFTVTLTDAPITGTFGEGATAMTFTNGVATFTLADGESKTATGLPLGVAYKVEETEANKNGFVTTFTGDTGNISSSSSASFTNTRQEGGLIVSKKVVSDVTADKSKEEFSFTVTIKNGDAVAENVTGTYKDMEFTKGVATFTLKDGDTKSAEGLPVGYTFTVAETEESDFKTEYKDNIQSGTIVKKEVQSVEVTNTRKTGSIVINKTVVSPVPAEQTAEYTFEVTLKHGEELLNGTYVLLKSEAQDQKESITFEKGKAVVTVKGGGSVTISGIPCGTTYTVAEETVEGTEENEKFDVEITGGTGVIEADTAKEVDVTNTRKTGSLEVSKEVVNKNEKNKAIEFKFTVTLTDTTISGEFGEGATSMTFKNGVAEFTLKDGEKKTATGLPSGVGYTVTEEEVAGFVTTMTGDSDTIVADETKTAAFVNTYDAAGEVVIEGVKVLKGQDLKAGQFRFVLSDEKGNKVLEASNDASGNFKFDTIKYTFADLDGEVEKVFTYGVTEVNDGQKNVTYDKTAHTIKVTVTDNGDGTLTAKADKKQNQVKFTNTYNPPTTPPSNKTGDSANGALWALVLALAAGALAGTIWFRRRRKV